MQPKRNPEQNRRIWGLVSRLGRVSGLGRAGAEDVMRVICVEISNQEHTSELSPQQADRLIAELEMRVRGAGVGGQGSVKSLTGPRPPSPGPRCTAPDPSATISKQQQAVLQHLYKDAGINAPAAFNTRVIHKPWPQTRGDANKLYQALEAMIVRKLGRTEVQTIVYTLLSIDFKWRLTAWEKWFVEDMKGQLAVVDSGNYRAAHKLSKLLEIWRTRAEGKEIGGVPLKYPSPPCGRGKVRGR